MVLGGAEGTAAAAWVVGPAAGGAYPYWGLATARRGRRASENTVDSILKVAVVNDGEQGGDGGGPGMAADWQAVRDSSEGTCAFIAYHLTARSSGLTTPFPRPRFMGLRSRAAVDVLRRRSRE